jgi:hypothetical protein
MDVPAQGIEVRDAVLVLDDYLAIDQGRLATELGAGPDHPAIRSRPVPAMTGEGSDLALVDDDQGR